METSRPLDALNAARNKRVIGELKNGQHLIGNLKAFDIHINTVLEEAEERVNGETTRKLGTVFLRGDAVILISPAQWVKEQQALEENLGRKPTFIVEGVVTKLIMQERKFVLAVDTAKLPK